MTKINSPQVIHPVKQQRSLQTQQKILAVVEKLVLSGQFEQSTVQTIVQQAGCSVGAFYGRFKDKRAVLFSFYDTRCSQLEQLAIAVLNPQRRAKLATIIKDFTHLIVSHSLQHAEFIRTGPFSSQTVKNDVFLVRAQQLNALLYKSLQKLLAQRKQELKYRINNQTSMFLLAIIGGLTRDGIVTGRWLIKKGSIDGQRFEQELNRAVSRYLGL